MHLTKDIAPLAMMLPRGELFGFSSGDVEEKANVVNLDKLAPLVVDVVCTYDSLSSFLYIYASHDHSHMRC
jgi:hypothetical protein